MKNFLKKLTNHKDFWPLLIVIALGLLAGRHLFGDGYFNMHDDLHMMRQLQIEKCLLDRQIPCRWVPDMGYGFGYPLFNYYPPLPYLVGQGIRIIGFSFITASKMMFAVAMILPGIFMYLLAKNLYKDFVKKDTWSRLGAVLSAVFYTWAPYHSVDIYVRGAMNEAWALIFFPAILWTSLRLIKEKQNKLAWIIGLALSWFGLLTSHNLMAMIFAPLFVLWVLYWLVREKSLSPIRSLAVSEIWALGFAAFFTLPVLAEKDLVRVEEIKQGYYSYQVHFVTIKQLLIDRFWGYGPSVWLEEDRMSFQIGQIHWLLPLIIAIAIVYKLATSKKNKTTQAVLFLPILLVFSYGWFAAFMTHLRSHFIWESFDAITFLQFPWRFLGIVIFCFSLVAGFLPIVLSLFKVHFTKTKYISSFLAVAVILFNFSYFQPESMGPLRDDEKFSGKAWEKLQTAGIYDYLPITAKMAPQAKRKDLVEFTKGSAEITDIKEGTNWAKFRSSSSEEARVRLNIIDFPQWTIFVDGNVVSKSIDNDNWGRIHFTIPTGNHDISARLLSTQVRTISNYISTIAWLLLIAVLIKSLLSSSPFNRQK